MTSQECESREQRLIESIAAVLSVHETLQPYSKDLSVSIEDSTIIIRGRLPSTQLRSQLIPAVRKAGVLEQVVTEVEVTAAKVS